jgi:endoglycosylceramidase
VALTPCPCSSSSDVGEAKGSGETPGGAQYQPSIAIDPDVRAQLEEWGFNVLRLPMMWSGVATADGAYDDAYLSTMAQVVRDLASNHVYSLLDMHQDVLSSTLGEYDGAPQWVTNRTVRRHEYPWPLTEPLQAWGLGYVAEATGQSFQEIYDNTHGGLDAWGAFWAHVAATMANVPGVLGYELMNEPWAGDIYAQPSLLTPGQAGSVNLQPAYKSVASAIRAEDDETLIFYEPVTWGMIFPGDGDEPHGAAGSGFSEVPGGAAYANRSALSYHYYCWWLSQSGTEPMPQLEKKTCDGLFAPQVFDTVAHDIARLGGASMLTEFGAMVPNATNPRATNTEEIRAVVGLADSHLQSWTHWDINDDVYQKNTKTWNLDAVKAFVRTYAQAIAGTPTSMTFDPTTNAFELRFAADPSLGAPTEVVAPALLYPGGFTVTVSGAAGLTWELSADRPGVIVVTAAAAGEGVVTIEANKH